MELLFETFWSPCEQQRPVFEMRSVVSRERKYSKGEREVYIFEVQLKVRDITHLSQSFDIQ
jgi:hypothetical protein